MVRTLAASIRNYRPPAVATFSALTVEEQEQLAEMLEKIRVTWEEIDG